jgi:hypothetical protein
MFAPFMKRPAMIRNIPDNAHPLAAQSWLRSTNRMARADMFLSAPIHEEKGLGTQ